MGHFINQFFRLDLSQCYFLIGTEHYFSLFGRNTGFCNFRISRDIGMQMCKVSDWFPIMPLCSLWSKGFSWQCDCEWWRPLWSYFVQYVKLFQHRNLCSGQVNMQLCGFRCIPRYSISVIINNASNFIILLACSLQGFPVDSGSPNVVS